MGNAEWKAKLVSFFEDLRLIENFKEETVKNFDQFCEFIAEPAFESLAEELGQYRIKSKLRKSKGKSIDFQINFPGTRIDNFHYIICLPKNALELKLKLKIRARRNKNSIAEENEEHFLENTKPPDLLKLAKEDIILDVIEHYKNFNFKVFTVPR